MITEENKQKGRAISDPAFSLSPIHFPIYRLNSLFLPYPANPINPEPSRSMVEGSGTDSRITLRASESPVIKPFQDDHLSGTGNPK